MPLCSLVSVLGEPGRGEEAQFKIRNLIELRPGTPQARYGNVRERQRERHAALWLKS